MKKIIYGLVFFSVFFASFVSSSPPAFGPGEVSINIYAYCSNPEYDVVSVEVMCDERYPDQEYPASVLRSEKRHRSDHRNSEGWWLVCGGGHTKGTIVLTCCKNETVSEEDCDCETVVRQGASWGFSGEYFPPSIVNRSKEFEIPEIVLPEAGAVIGDVAIIELFDGIVHNCTITTAEFNVMGTYSVSCNFDDLSLGYAIFATTDGRTGSHIYSPLENYNIRRDPDSGKSFLEERVTLHRKHERFECVFENSYSIQRCHPEGFGGGCLGINNCLTSISYWDKDYPEKDIKSSVGKEVVWISTCGNVSMVLGVDEPGRIVFDCEEEASPDRLIDCESGYFPKYLEDDVDNTTNYDKEDERESFLKRFANWFRRIFSR